ncbi:hypothetical protein JCM19046_2306 [Bacillus sp. JCM 19046]|nr:hypothetical protein JCM19045_1867 [Bacillus sp. JCM 19045]GAF17778.1 hypothetical protein JCM19046_2306 [Bacillus sp. JCM 19046]
MRYIDNLYGIPIRYTDQITDRVQLLTSSQGLYILKKHPNSLKAKQEAELLHFLHTRGLSVPLPLETRHRSYVFTQENSYYTLKSYLPGSPLPMTDLLSKPELMSIVGSELATLHDHFLDKEANLFRKRHLIQSLFSNVIPFLEAHEIALDVVSVLRHHEMEIKETFSSLPVQLIHRDLHFNHFLFHHNQFSGMIDFEHVEENIRLFDLVTLRPVF